MILCAGDAECRGVGLWSPNGKADTGRLLAVRNADRRTGHPALPARGSRWVSAGAIPPLALPALPALAATCSWFKAVRRSRADWPPVAAVAFALRRRAARRRTVRRRGRRGRRARRCSGRSSVNSFDLWPAALARVGGRARRARDTRAGGLRAASAPRRRCEALPRAARARRCSRTSRTQRAPTAEAPARRRSSANRASSSAIFSRSPRLAPRRPPLQPPGAGDARAPGREPRRLDPRRRAPARRELPRRRLAELALLVRHRRTHRQARSRPCSRSSRSSAVGRRRWLLVPRRTASTVSGRSAPSPRRPSASSRSRRCSRPQYLLFLVPLVPLVDSRRRVGRVRSARARADAGLGALPGSVPPHDATRLRDLGCPRPQRRPRRPLRAPARRAAAQEDDDQRVERDHEQVAHDDPPREDVRVVIGRAARRVEEALPAPKCVRRAMTRRSTDATAPAAGTSGTSQLTYCGEKLFANATNAEHRRRPGEDHRLASPVPVKRDVDEHERGDRDERRDGREPPSARAAGDLRLPRRCGMQVPRGAAQAGSARGARRRRGSRPRARV